MDLVDRKGSSRASIPRLRRMSRAYSAACRFFGVVGSWGPVILARRRMCLSVACAYVCASVVSVTVISLWFEGGGSG